MKSGIKAYGPDFQKVVSMGKEKVSREGKRATIFRMVELI